MLVSNFRNDPIDQSGHDGLGGVGHGGGHGGIGNGGGGHVGGHGGGHGGDSYSGSYGHCGGGGHGGSAGGHSGGQCSVVYLMLVSLIQTIKVTTSQHPWDLGQGVVQGRFQGICSCYFLGTFLGQFLGQGPKNP